MLARFLIKAMQVRKYGLFGPVIALLVIGGLFAAITPTVAAQETSGALFTGMGFIDDHSVEDGVVVEAWIRGNRVAATEIFNQGFILYVEEPPGESFDGEVVKFKFRGLETDAVAEWVEGTESWILLYAYTGLRGAPDGFNGNETAYPETDHTNAITELEARLSQLKRERFRLAAELERQTAIEIAEATDFWEQAINDLEAEVDREIQRVTGDYEFEARQILLGGRRDGSLRSMKAKLDAVIEEKWTWFDFESALKQQYLHDDIVEIERAKELELTRLRWLIEEVESELSDRLAGNGSPTHENRDASPNDSPEPVRQRATHEPPEEVSTDQIPETSQPEESERHRGFFINSISADANSIDKMMDPTALAVLGILITLVATAAQLIKGN